MSHALKAIGLADKVLTLVEDGLAGLDATTKHWPAEYRAIIWQAAADIASSRAAAASAVTNGDER